MGVRMLTNDQKRIQIDISRDILSRYKDDPVDFIEQVVTQEETWVHHFDLESKCRANNGSILAHPLIRHLRGLFSGKGDGLNLLG